MTTVLLISNEGRAKRTSEILHDYCSENKHFFIPFGTDVTCWSVRAICYIHWCVSGYGDGLEAASPQALGVINEDDSF